MTTPTNTGETLKKTVIFGNAEVQLEAFFLFSNVEVRVPASWRVMLDVQPLFGSVRERGVAPTAGGDSPTLRISGTALFASFELERF